MASSSTAVPSTPSAPSTTVTPDTLITVKVAIDGNNRRFKLPLRDLNSQLFPQKIRTLLQVQPHQKLHLERFSDSSTSYITLDPTVPSPYKQLYRAAKAKLKLRIKATIVDESATILVDESTSVSTVVPPTLAAQPVTVTKAPAIVPPPAVVAKPNPTTVTAGSGAPAAESPLGEQRYPPCATMSRIAQMSNPSMGFSPRAIPAQPPFGPWQVFCNNCEEAMVDAHFHCSICDGGDYDLCEACVESGKLCPGEGHWLLKRYIKHGKVVASTTERAIPKPATPCEKEPEMPGAFTADTKLDQQLKEIRSQVRTCNGCIRVLPENLLVTCKDCDDFDFCMRCHMQQNNGHNPAHRFAPVVDGPSVPKLAQTLCAPGRNFKHAACCDGCDKTIFGVRHKCLDCPDWDFCNGCFADASTSHPNHRFVPVYDVLAIPSQNRTIHYGVYCDGPLCKTKPRQLYIKGIRYKCAVCDDLDFCANCEAHPTNEHNDTHPMHKFKTYVAHVTSTTIHETAKGVACATVGDRYSPYRKPADSAAANSSAEALPPYTAVPEPKQDSANEATDSSKEAPSIPVPKAVANETSPKNDELDACFVRDVVEDGTVLPPDTGFQQAWTLRNPGPHAWPVGCRVRHVGGDNMLNIRRSRVASVSELTHAMESEPTEEAIEPGREIDFPVWMRTPSAAGKYISYWRLQAPNGMSFGHKLWCDVQVIKTDSTPASPPHSTLPVRNKPADPPKSCFNPPFSAFANPPPVPMSQGPSNNFEPQSSPAGADGYQYRPNLGAYTTLFPRLDRRNPAAPKGPNAYVRPPTFVPPPKSSALLEEQVQRSVCQTLNITPEEYLKHMKLLEEQRKAMQARLRGFSKSPDPCLNLSADERRKQMQILATYNMAKYSAVQGTTQFPQSGTNDAQKQMHGPESQYRAWLQRCTPHPAYTTAQENSSAYPSAPMSSFQQPNQSKNVNSNAQPGAEQAFTQHPAHPHSHPPFHGNRSPYGSGRHHGFPEAPVGYQTCSLPAQNRDSASMPTPDRRTAHAAAAIAAANATMAKIDAMKVNVKKSQSSPDHRELEPVTEQSDKGFEAGPSETGKKLADIRDYLVDKKDGDAQIIEDGEKSLESSAMVFPKIERDGSPATSTHLGGTPTAAATSPSTKQGLNSSHTDANTETETITSADVGQDEEDEEEAFEDLSPADVPFDDLQGHSESEDDTGFLTDEEYDILDASDEEIMSNPGQDRAQS